MIKALISWWRRRQRAIDTRVLWPVICQQTVTETQARDAFLFHALRDEAWSDLSAPEIVRRVVELDWPHPRPKENDRG